MGLCMLFYSFRVEDFVTWVKVMGLTVNSLKDQGANMTVDHWRDIVSKFEV